jgi:hypothetical protein
MPSTNSGGPEKVDAMPSERVVGMAQNEWTASIGIDGRHGPDYALDGINRRLSEIEKELSGQYGPLTDARVREVKKKQRQLEDRAKVLVDSIETSKAALQAVEGETAPIEG